MIDITPELLFKIFKFGIVGLTGMVVDFGTTWVCREKLKWNQYIANSCGVTLAIINNYILNRFWTFQSTQNWVPEFGLFVLFSVIGLGLNNLFVYFFNEKLKLNFYLAKAFAIACVVVWNFVANYQFNFH